MRAGPFLSAVAAGLCVEEKTVRVFAREMRLAGLLSTGARGVNAPDMTAEDVAKLVLALLATDRPSRAVEMLKHFGAMQLLEHAGVAPALGLSSKGSHTFLELMEFWCDPTVAIPIGFRIEAIGTSCVKLSKEGPETSGVVGAMFFYSSEAKKSRLHASVLSNPLVARGLIVSRSISSADLAEIRGSIFGTLAHGPAEEN